MYIQCNVHLAQPTLHSACNIVTTFQRYQSCFSVAVAPSVRRQRARALANAAPHTPASVHAHRTRTHVLIATVALRCAPPRSLERRERRDRRLSAMERRLQGSLWRGHSGSVSAAANGTSVSPHSACTCCARRTPTSSRCCARSRCSSADFDSQFRCASAAALLLSLGPRRGVATGSGMLTGTREGAHSRSARPSGRHCRNAHGKHRRLMRWGRPEAGRQAERRVS